MLDDLEKSVLKIYEEVKQMILNMKMMNLCHLSRLLARMRPASAPSTC